MEIPYTLLVTGPVVLEVKIFGLLKDYQAVTGVNLLILEIRSILQLMKNLLS